MPSDAHVGTVVMGNAMRWARLLVECMLRGALLADVFLLYISATHVRVPILPHLVFILDKDSLVVQGTWRREDGDDAWPSQTTTIECERSTRRCREASAVLAGNGHLMPVTKTLLDEALERLPPEDRDALMRDF